eukprot:755234-Hanusia_phi.AAC.4
MVLPGRRRVKGASEWGAEAHVGYSETTDLNMKRGTSLMEGGWQKEGWAGRSFIGPQALLPLGSVISACCQTQNAGCDPGPGAPRPRPPGRRLAQWPDGATAAVSGAAQHVPPKAAEPRGGSSLWL